MFSNINHSPRIDWLAIPVGPTGGNIKRYMLWAKHIDHTRYEATLTYLLHLWPGEDVIRSSIGDNRVKLVPIRANGTMRYALALIAVIRQWSRSMPQIVHSLNPISDLIAVAAKRILRSQVPIISMTGGAKIATTPIRKRIYKNLHGLAKNDINLFVTVSEYDKHELINEYGIPNHKIIVHRIGIDCSQFYVNKDFSPNRPFTFGFAGRFSFEKGLNYLLEATRILVGRTREKGSRNPPFRLLLAGDGNLRPEIEQLAQAAGIGSQVEFLGWINDISKFLNQIDILVLPSLWEGTPRIILEGFYHCVPVIATDVGGISEIVEHRKTGFLVPPRSPEALAGAMEFVIGKRALLSEMGTTAQRYMMEYHGIEKSIRHIEHLYNTLLTNR